MILDYSGFWLDRFIQDFGLFRVLIRQVSLYKVWHVMKIITKTHCCHICFHTNHQNTHLDNLLLLGYKWHHLYSYHRIVHIYLPMNSLHKLKIYIFLKVMTILEEWNILNSYSFSWLWGRIVKKFIWNVYVFPFIFAVLAHLLFSFSSTQ